MVKRRSTPRLLRSPTASLGAGLALLLVLIALIGPLLVGNPDAQSLANRLLPPLTPGHLLGTDQLGRDMMTRLIFGARLSLLLSAAVVASAAALGMLIGIFAGLSRGWIDELLMRITDIFLAFPALILAMAIAGALGPSLATTGIAVAAVSWPYYARLIRSQVLSIREYEFVEAARALGASNIRIALRHLLPNSLTPILVQASFDIGSVILIASGLSFIGFGAQPPSPEWGAMVSAGQYFMAQAWWVSSLPAIFILLTVLAFNLLGDGLRDLLDPKR